MKCRNCGEPIDEFIGKTTGATVILHVIKCDVNTKEGYLWAYKRESDNFCRNPQK